jgi:hypothetical protein
LANGIQELLKDVESPVSEGVPRRQRSESTRRARVYDAGLESSRTA